MVADGSGNGSRQRGGGIFNMVERQDSNSYLLL
jgi:hypothetical protein